MIHLKHWTTDTHRNLSERDLDSRFNNRHIMTKRKAEAKVEETERERERERERETESIETNDIP